MLYISLALQCIFIIVFLSPIITNLIVPPLVVDILWILAIISGVCIGLYQVISKFKIKSDFKNKITISLSLFLLVFYIFGLGLDKM